MSTYSPPTVIYTLSLHDALPIFSGRGQAIAAPHGALVVQRERDLSPRADLQRVGRERQAAIRGSRAARAALYRFRARRSEEHTSELQSLAYLVCRLLLEKKKK